MIPYLIENVYHTYAFAQRVKPTVIKLATFVSGYAYDPDCMYINGTGRDYYEFYIQLNRCGTLGKNTHHEDSRKNPTVSIVWSKYHVVR